jgi:hypothetical protein
MGLVEGTELVVIGAVGAGVTAFAGSSVARFASAPAASHGSGAAKPRRPLVKTSANARENASGYEYALGEEVVVCCRQPVKTHPKLREMG